MTVLLFLFALWLIGIWIFAIGVIVLAALLAWRIAWTVGAFAVRFVIALLDGPERGAR